MAVTSVTITLPFMFLITAFFAYKGKMITRSLINILLLIALVGSFVYSVDLNVMSVNVLYYVFFLRICSAYGMIVNEYYYIYIEKKEKNPIKMWIMNCIALIILWNIISDIVQVNAILN